MSVLILHTFGILKHAAGHPASQPFMATSPGVTESVPGTPGLLKNSITSFMPDGTCMSKEAEFGIPPTPTFFEKDITGMDSRPFPPGPISSRLWGSRFIGHMVTR